uniref:Pro-interleukin-16 n=1 Tax=Ascaris suum TaxID=6253 RepID=F1L8S5_ASCSU
MNFFDFRIFQVQNVITGSIADHSDFIDRGDRVFFIQGRSTRMMSTSEARALIKSPAPVVSFVLGRCRSSDASTFTPAPLELFSTVSIDPDRFHYSQKAEEVVLMKGNLGVGLALDGGRGSIYGDRPIVVKRIFEGGSAAKSGRIKVGDQIIAIDGVATNGLSYLEATKTLRSRPEGPVTITIYSRI